MLLTLGRSKWVQLHLSAKVRGQQPDPVLNFDGKKYAIKALSDETKELIKGVRVADGQA